MCFKRSPEGNAAGGRLGTWNIRELRFDPAERLPRVELFEPKLAFDDFRRGTALTSGLELLGEDP